MTSILDTNLKVCSKNPLTGYQRDGYCKNTPGDTGTHVVCAKVTDEFLSFTKSRGNNLTTPSPAHNFPGLKDGDQWCLCALRWEEARKVGKAPPVILNATDKSALHYNDFNTYKKYSYKKRTVKNGRRNSRKTRKQRHTK